MKKALILAILLSTLCGCETAKSFITVQSIMPSTEPHVVVLSWQPSPLARSYNIHRSSQPGGPFVKIGSSTTTTFLDFVSAPTTFYYYVTAVGEPRESRPSARFRVALP